MPRRSHHSGALAHLLERFIGDDPKKLASLERARVEANIAQQIYDLRTAAQLTQRQLAARVGTSASVICRLEDSNYERHSLSLLHRIASALGARIELRFVAGEGGGDARPAKRRRKSA